MTRTTRSGRHYSIYTMRQPTEPREALNSRFGRLLNLRRFIQKLCRILQKHDAIAKVDSLLQIYCCDENRHNQLNEVSKLPSDHFGGYVSPVERQDPATGASSKNTIRTFNDDNSERPATHQWE